MASIEERVESLIKAKIEKIGYELYDVEYSKEGKNYFLRIFIDSKNGIDLDDCEKVNNEIMEDLDNANYIKEQYFLEVSCPGIERILRKEKHLEQNIGNEIAIKLFKKDEEGKKEYQGILKKYTEQDIIIEDNENKQKQIILSLEELEKERGIKKDYLLEAIETALVTAYKRNFDSLENVKVVMDRQTGATHVYSIKEVMKKANDDVLEISLKDAQKINKDLKEGDQVEIEIVPKDFGRIAAQTAKQVIIQKLREAERDIIFTEFNDRKGEIVSGLIQKADKNIVVMDLGKLEGVMPAKEQIPTEKYRVNDKIKGYVLDVQRGAKGAPQVIVSRSHPDFVKKLLEFEIPEIYEGVIEIKSVSRDAGYRSKVAVYSPDENIDPVGSCVGQKGVRIQNVINELNGEKIDVIEWNEDPSIYISSALLPAKILAVDIKQEERFAQVIVPDDQLSLAIGKSGQNARLAAKLTNWKIDIKSETQFRQMLEEAQSSDQEEKTEE